MNDVQKMFRTIVNGQSAMKSEILAKIDSLDKKLSGRIDSLDKKIDGAEERLTKRMDRIGLQLANLEDLPAMLRKAMRAGDCPARDEFDELAGRVTKIENFQSV